MQPSNQAFPVIPIRPVFEMTMMHAYLDLRKRLDYQLALEWQKYQFEKELTEC